MSQIIRIPDDLYKRLSLHAKGFETPANVIEKLLNFFEEQKGDNQKANLQSLSVPLTSTSLEIIYYPHDENSFKKEFLRTKKAYILMHKVDGSTELKEWNAYRFHDQASVSGNLRSGYLRGWRTKGIFKAEISTNQNDLILLKEELKGEESL